LNRQASGSTRLEGSRRLSSTLGSVPRRHWLRRALDPNSSPLPYLLPPLLFITIFLAYPILEVIRQSFFHIVPIRPWEPQAFVGVDNYLALARSPAVQRALSITVGWTLLAVAGKFIVGFVAALLLQRPFPGRRLYLTLLMIPWVTPMVVAAVVWRWVLNSEYGQFNGLLDLLGLPVVPWLGQTGTAFIATATVDMWIGIPFVTMVLMAGLQSIPDELYEAAVMDGAGALSRFRHITLPQLRPILLVVLLLSSVWTFNSFEVIYPMTKGGPAGATTTLVIQTYQTAFGSFDFGRAAALSTVIFLLLLAVSFGYWRLLGRDE
jgi:multiple sugar transport system permease protein